MLPRYSLLLQEWRSEMSATISGGCLCATVTFELLNKFNQFHLCDRTECSKIIGTAHASNLFASAKNIK